MIKLLKRTGLVAVLTALVWCGILIADHQTLGQELIRLHVVADSNETDAQALKLQVRDAIVDSLQQAMADVADVEEAKAYLRAHLPQLQALANQVLSLAGSDLNAVVTLAEEAFPTREYDTFTLPAGVYESLRITIGEGAGKNWWCVVFPEFCIPATSEGVETVAAGSGFKEDLTAALTGEEGYEIRFFFLDCLGKIENFFYRG